MWKFVTKKRTPDDIVLRLPDPAKATSKEAAEKKESCQYRDRQCPCMQNNDLSVSFDVFSS
jgi:hypothetical protein